MTQREMWQWKKKKINLTIHHAGNQQASSIVGEESSYNVVIAHDFQYTYRVSEYRNLRNSDNNYTSFSTIRLKLLWFMFLFLNFRTKETFYITNVIFQQFSNSWPQLQLWQATAILYPVNCVFLIFLFFNLKGTFN